VGQVGRAVQVGRVGLTLTAIAMLAGVVAGQPAANPCSEFDRLYAAIRDQTIDRASAEARVRALLPQIREYFREHRATPTPADAWRFPVEGYDAGSIGGKNGSGYVADGYDYFDGYKSHGHPGHDIFIHDKNEDEMDDATGKPVNVLSISAGIVVAYSPEWKKDSQLRGGRYLYIYDPAADGLFYYAHNRSLAVKPGDVVAAGQVIATVGRSGRNASAPRSPTHLHVMFLSTADGYPRPRDIYQDLLRTGRRVRR
jgi:peptidoglycan LD-endopeptidase LytH